jgi:sugar/nucleoside kinase (ribokinase family)
VLLAALARGEDVSSALVSANRAAAIAVTRIGPATTPTAAELSTSANPSAHRSSRA